MGSMFASLASVDAMRRLQQLLHNQDYNNKDGMLDKIEQHPCFPMLRSIGYSSRRGRYGFEAENYHRTQLIGMFVHQVRAVIHTRRDSDAVRQWLYADEIMECWTKTCDHWQAVNARLRECDLSHIMCWTLAMLRGPAWTADGETLTRELPVHPFNELPTASPVAAYMGSLGLSCIGWTILGYRLAPSGHDEIAYLNVVGSQAMLHAGWAYIMDAQKQRVILPKASNYWATRHDQSEIARRPEGKKALENYWNDEPLPTSGKANLVMLHPSAFQPKTGAGCLHLTGSDGEPDLPMFFRQLDAIITLPIVEEWARALWEGGLERKLILRLDSFACTGYWLLPTEGAWAKVITEAAGLGTPRVETIGGDQSDTTIALVRNEDDDGKEDDDNA